MRLISLLAEAAVVVRTWPRQVERTQQESRMHLQKQKKHWLIRLNKVIVKRICLWQILFWVEARKKYKKIGKNHKKQLTF